MGDKSAFVGIVTKLIDITGKALSGEWGTDDVDGCGIPVLRTTNFTNVGKVNYDNVVTRNIQKKNISEKLLKKGDIIIEKSGGTDKKPVGRVIYFEGEENKYLFNNFTGLLRVKDKNEWYPKYVFYSMFANYNRGGTRRFENKTTGLHNLKLDDYIKRLDIQKVSYVDQIYVCKLLDCVRLQIDNMERELDLLDELVKARFVEMFGEIEDCDRWKSKIWNEVVTIQNGRDYKKVLVNDGGYPVVGTGGEIARASGYLCPENTIVVGRKGSINNPMLMKEKFWNVDTAFGVIPNSDYLHYQYFYYFCKFYNFMKLNKATTLPSTTKADLLKIRINIPPLELQNQFASFVQEVDKSRLLSNHSLSLIKSITF